MLITDIAAVERDTPAPIFSGVIIVLVISRERGESIVIVPCGATANSSSVKICIDAIDGDCVQLSSDAPEFFRVLRHRNATHDTDA